MTVMRFPDLNGGVYGAVYGEIAAGTAAGSLPAWARDVLADVARGRSPIAPVRHPLGFLCLPVERRGELGVCLHIWSPQVAPAPSTTSLVHCHSWDLVSFVLYGKVRNMRARVVEEGPATHRVFEVLSRGAVDELRATGRTVRYSPGDAATHRTGETYSLPAGAFHSTFIEDEPDAATVALGRQTADGGDLSLGPLDTPTHQVRRMNCDPDEAARAALRSAQRIAAEYSLTPRSVPAPSADPARPGGTGAGAARQSSSEPAPPRPGPDDTPALRRSGRP
ncbi:hypothetical protein ABZ801_05880 [Actinomadura sp. NPDC047616]|uniref:hypothetical protein n=1 Tax=Actinomadura sp. NPDC047616 TaxID=3155914 RepID=UPI0034016A0C